MPRLFQDCRHDSARITRRDLIRSGTAGLAATCIRSSLGLTAFGLPQRQEVQTANISAKRFLLIFLQGGPSHIDLWDPKPNAPASVRGQFNSIKTNVAGIHLTEVLPRLAYVMDKVTLVRSCSYSPAGLFHHNAAVHEVLTGQVPKHCAASGEFSSEHDQDTPFYLSKIANSLGVTPNVISCEKGRKLNSTDASQLKCNLPKSQVNSLTTELFVPQYVVYADERALILEQEGEDVLDAYGRNAFGHSLLTARRLLEAGSKVVQVSWPEPLSLDTHQDMNMIKKVEGPKLDAGLSTLIRDLDSCGLLDETIVLVLGEFGRSPNLGLSNSGNAIGAEGRDHWPYCFTAIIAGGGVARGAVYGTSDNIGAYPKENPVHPGQLFETVSHALGIRHNEQVLNGVAGSGHKPICELFG